MNWKQYMIKKGYIYSEPNDDYRKGLGWGKSVKVWMFMKGLFIIEKDNKVIYKDFPESFKQFKTIIDGIDE